MGPEEDCVHARPPREGKATGLPSGSESGLNELGAGGVDVDVAVAVLREPGLAARELLEAGAVLLGVVGGRARLPEGQAERGSPGDDAPLIGRRVDPDG